MALDDLAGPEFTEEDDAPPDPSETRLFSQAVLYASDWTVETVVSQLERGNIELNPQFQRRDAWNVRAKSRFIESVILGLPIPQIVLAEKVNQRGRYIVLDGKQRLLSLLQFTGKFNGPQNAFGLSGLQVRSDLVRKKYRHFEGQLELQDDLNAFHNHTIRTVVIRNWPGIEFLHLVFLRLNTGSLKLSPQELRQALIPGEFSRYIDDAASNLDGLQILLGRSSPDPRMRDVELLVRFLSFHNFINDYVGRMKSFLDYSCGKLNNIWTSKEEEIKTQVEQFDEAVKVLIELLGLENIARKPESRQFNRAIFDALIFYAANERIRMNMLAAADPVKEAYRSILGNIEFLEAVESDTAGIPHTHRRLALWGQELQKAIGIEFDVPSISIDDGGKTERRITFRGF